MTMTLEQLKVQAAKILALPDVADGDFLALSFWTRSGGIPQNHVEVPVIRSSEQFRYETKANGSAFSGELVVMCQRTGAKDSQGRDIYRTPAGIVFVYSYRAGSPSSFDFGELVAPSLS